MQGYLERVLPVIATWGVWILGASLAITLIAIVVLGRGRPFLVPARWPARLGSAALLVLSLLIAAGLRGVLGPLAPVLGQVRTIESLVGHPARELEFQQVSDETRGSLSDLRGKVVVLNLWATWCPPCRRELPQIDRLQQRYVNRGLVVVTLSNEPRCTLLEFAERHPVTTLNVHATELGWLDVPGRPLSLVIDRGGIVRRCVIGGRDSTEFAAMVKPYL